MSPTKLVLVFLCLICIIQGRLLPPSKSKGFSMRTNSVMDSEPSSCFEGTIPGYDQKVYSGYLPVGSGSSSYLFYAFYYALNATQDTNTPVTIWINGGPGCSSMDGNFEEMGPYRLVYNPETEQYDQVQRPLDETWNANSHMLFIDQPVGTGYSLLNSTDDLVQSATEAAENFYYALQQFYAVSETPCNFDNLKKNPLFIFGESFAGHYIPAISAKILSANKSPESGMIEIPLKGIGIGDGLTDSPNQVTYYGLYAYSLALIDEVDRTKVEYLAQSSYYLASKDSYFQAMNLWGEILEVIGEADGDMNVYNIYLQGDYDESDLSDFCNSEQAFEQFNLYQGTEWELCSNAVYMGFKNDLMKSYADDVATSLKEIPVLLYNGQFDLIVNTPGAQNWIHKMEWDGRDQFNAAAYTPWNVSDNIVGYLKSSGNLNFVMINKAGHMVPMDQPIYAKLMFDSFVEKVLGESESKGVKVELEI